MHPVCMFSFQTASAMNPSSRLEIEAESLAGSTVGLMGHDRLRQSGHSFTSPFPHDPEHAQGTANDNIPVHSEKGDKSAPIISIPGTDTTLPMNTASHYSTEDEVMYPARKRPRPVANFNLQPSVVPDADC